jgi:RNA polymerase sigma-70 factor (ECF subfamily)
VRGRIVDERQYADLAAEWTCSEAVVRQRVSRGLTALRKRFGVTF